MPTKHLILGGARSGKSAFAEKCAMQIAQSTQKQLVYIATAEAGDEEMRQRIQRHQSDRDDRWILQECPIKLADAVTHAGPEHCILIDCLTLWLSNCLHEENWPEHKNAFLKAIQLSESDIILVSNEVGSGIIPIGELSRQFVDELGWLHQRLAKICDAASMVVAGLELKLK